MDTPRQLPSDDQFNELPEVRIGDFGERRKRRVVGRAELESHVLALEAHAWASQRVAAMVTRLMRLIARDVEL